MITIGTRNKINAKNMLDFIDFLNDPGETALFLCIDGFYVNGNKNFYEFFGVDLADIARGIGPLDLVKKVHHGQLLNSIMQNRSKKVVRIVCKNKRKGSVDCIASAFHLTSKGKTYRFIAARRCNQGEKYNEND